jgi:hypothetical protein
MRHIPAALALVLLSCGSTVQHRNFGPPPEALTVATLSGPLCEGASCRCSQVPGDAGLPDTTRLKRFELRIETPGELWVTIGSGAGAMRLYKSSQRVTECFYVDLTAGDHPVSLRGHAIGGFAAGLHISELAKIGDAPSAYATFDFTCGGPDPCTLDRLAEFKKSLARFPRSIHDPCGSVKIRQIAWETGKAPDQMTPEDLELSMVLDVYNFPPKSAHGDPACATAFE